MWIRLVAREEPWRLLKTVQPMLTFTWMKIWQTWPFGFTGLGCRRIRKDLQRMGSPFFRESRRTNCWVWWRCSPHCHWFWLFCSWFSLFWLSMTSTVGTRTSFSKSLLLGTSRACRCSVKCWIGAPAKMARLETWHSHPSTASSLSRTWI